MDEFAPARAGDQDFTLVLGYDRVRRCARDWERYTSATPFRVPIPEESQLRPVQQLPIETDPPEHRMYRHLIEHRFSRGAADRIRPALAERVDQVLTDAIDRGELAVVHDLAIPIVTAAFAATIGRPADAERLASWGLHVFRDPETGRRRRNTDLDHYLADCVDEARSRPGDDLFGDLTHADLDGRRLTRDELLGYGYLVLAGGRDTVIVGIVGALWHLARHPDARRHLRIRPDDIATAVEEYLRYFSPLAYIGRTVTDHHDVGGHRFATGDLVGLGFAAANHDPGVFDRPDEVLLDRSPNRHVAFGYGPHTCIGAPLARMELQTVVERFVSVRDVEIVTDADWSPPVHHAVSTSSWIPDDLIIRFGSA